MKHAYGFLCLAVVSLCPAQQAPGTTSRLARVVYFTNSGFAANDVSDADLTAALVARLRALNFPEGERITFERKEAPRSQMEAMMRDAVRAGASVLVARSTSEAVEALRATRTVPVVFWSSDPVAGGIVKGLDKPGTNATGVTFTTHNEEAFLNLLKAVVPGLRRVAMLFNRSYEPGQQARVLVVAPHLGLTVKAIEVTSEDAMEDAFHTAMSAGAQAVYIVNHGIFFSKTGSARLGQLALKYNLPAFAPYPHNAAAGALLARDQPDNKQRGEAMADCIAKILSGTRPEDIPVQQVVRQRTILNRTVARKLGLTISDMLLQSVDKVID
ncbi:MAG: ABC transporter substrate-binding protein [Bryobacterales bacterium]|nr:ABC transporter substrate-binding protein [Bryobacterales bacterium]